MGDIRHLKIYCVCGPCNNGWMRQQVDEAAKPILTKLIKGERTLITPDEQKKIAAWAVLKLMVSEYENGDITFHHAQRKRMMRKRLPPEHGCMVWIGHYKRGNWPPHWIRNTFLLLPDERVKGSKDRRATYFNSVVSTQVIGELFIHIVNCPKRDFAAKLYPNEIHKGLIVPIWPLTGQTVPWPPRVTMRDGDANSLASFVIKFMAKISGIPPAG